MSKSSHPEWHALAKRMYDENISVSVIARIFQVSRDAVAYAVDHNGAKEDHRERVRRQREQRRLVGKQPEWHQEAWRMRALGYGVSRIATATGHSVSGVRYALNLNGYADKVRSSSKDWKRRHTDYHDREDRRSPAIISASRGRQVDGYWVFD